MKDTKAKVDQEKSASQKIQRKPASAVTVTRIAEIVDEARSQEQLTREEQIDYKAKRPGLRYAILVFFCMGAARDFEKYRIGYRRALLAK